MKEKKGFTLPELLVVAGVISIIGTLAVTIFVRSLRANNKSQILLSIKQNGQSAMDIIDKKVRSADKILCPFLASGVSSATSNTLVVDKAGILTRFRIVGSDIVNSNPTLCKTSGKSANGCIIQDNPYPDPTTPGDILPSPVPGGGYTTKFINEKCDSNNPIDSTHTEYNPVILTDTKTDTGVSVAPTSKGFTRERKSGIADFIKIDFDLGPGIDVQESIAGEIDPVGFRTAIELR